MRDGSGERYDTAGNEMRKASARNQNKSTRLDGYWVASKVCEENCESSGDVMKLNDMTSYVNVRESIRSTS